MNAIIEGPDALGLYIKKTREARGLTQARLAEHAGCSQGTVSRVERGDAVPNVALLLKILGALCVSMTLEAVCGS